MEQAMKRRPLHEIVRDYQELLWKSDETEGWEPEAALADCKAEMGDKIDACLGLAIAFGAQSYALNQRAKKYTEDAKRLWKRQARLVEYVKWTLESADVTRMQTEDFPSIAIRNNPPAVQVDEDAELPERYIKREEIIKILKVDIKRALQAGDDVPGCRLVQGTRLEY